MHLAAKGGKLDIFIALFNHGADITIKNKEGKTCFDLLKATKDKPDKLTVLTKIEMNLSNLEAHNYFLWFVVVQEVGTSDANLFAKLSAKVNTLVSSHSTLPGAKDADGRAAKDVASKPMRKVIESALFFCGQYEIHHGPAVHRSATSIVVFAEDFKVDDEYEAAAKEAAGKGESSLKPETFEKALAVLSKQGFGKATELLLDKANDKNRFKQCDKDDDGVVTTNEFVKYCETMLGRSVTMAIKFMRNKDQFLREIDARKVDDESLDENFVVGISHIYYYKKTEDNPSGVNLKLPLEFKREEVEHCDEVILDPSTKAERGNGVSEFSRFYAIIMEVADRNLKNIFDTERPSPNDIRKLAKSVGEAMGHLHSMHLMHGDLKMLNVVRMGSQLKLIDLDAIASFSSVSSSNLLTFAGAKFSSGILPPEMFACLVRCGT